MMQLLDIISETNKPASQILREFVETEKLTWPLAAANYIGLERVEERTFKFDGFEIRAQFNPKRMSSSVANVDKKTIAARSCFLCSENRPAEQEGIAFGEQFQILVNPFPIFRNHFTISSNTHVDQRFIPHVEYLLDLAEAMKSFTVFYNGPECGASAPDHLHFQAGESVFLPVTNEFEILKNHTGRILFAGKNTQVWAFDHYFRKMISIETSSKAEALEVIGIYYRIFQAMQPEKVEPMMNALCSWKGKWVIHLFPRKAHRPRQFFATGAEQILISPGSVDFGGVFILPRREDFEKLTKENVMDILEQVCVTPETFQELTDKMVAGLTDFQEKK